MCLSFIYKEIINFLFSREISFNAGISDWETKIYEHNEDF